LIGLSATNRYERIQKRIRLRSRPSTLPNGDSSGEGSRLPHKEYRPDIEGLRAVAVFAVVLFHAAVPGVGGGFIGVDVFFVISGFLITGLLWREVSTEGTVRLRQFYGARARRLLPASAAVGAITMVASVVLLLPLQARDVIADGIASALYVGNIWFVIRATDYFSNDGIPSPFQHYWSLGVEEQFYLVWPALIIATAWFVRLARRRTKVQRTSKSPYLVVLVLVAVGSFAASLAVTRMWPSAAFFLMPTRAWQLAVGGLVALTASQWRRIPALLAAIAGWAGLVLILLTCNRLGTSTPYPGTAALLPVVGTALVIGAGCAGPTHGVGRVMALPPMRAVGRASYSWYLWHWPVLVLSAPLLGHPLGLTGRLATVIISAGLAVLTLRFIENPLRFAPSVRRSAAGSLALGGAATAIAVCVGLASLVLVPVPVGRGAPAATMTLTATPVPAGSDMDAYDAAVRHAFAQVQTAVSASADVNVVPSNLNPPLADAAGEATALMLNGCMRSFFEVGQPECATGATASAKRVVLVGDSNAAMWNRAFAQVAEQRHWRLETMAKASCPLLNLRISNPRLQREYTECEQWSAQIIDRLRNERPSLVVLSISRHYGRNSEGVWSYSLSWNNSLTQLVQELRGMGAQVLVLGPVPDPHLTVPVCLSGHLDDMSACSPSRSNALNSNGIMAEAAATTAGGGHYTDLTELFCTADRCPAVVGNTLVYLDQVHVTLEYARLLAPAMGALADRAIRGAWNQ
jgi:peptidoglycan/LPS O-acetylase OafA/YrhL